MSDHKEKKDKKEQQDGQPISVDRLFTESSVTAAPRPYARYYTNCHDSSRTAMQPTLAELFANTQTPSAFRMRTLVSTLLPSTSTEYRMLRQNAPNAAAAAAAYELEHPTITALGNAPTPDITINKSPNSSGGTYRNSNVVVGPPMQVDERTLSRCVALVRFICFPDVLWQPNHHARPILAADAGVGGHTATPELNAVRSALQQIPLQTNNSYNNRPLRSNPHDGHQPPAVAVRDEAVLCAMVRLAELLEEQLLIGLAAQQYAELTSQVPHRTTSLVPLPGDDVETEPIPAVDGVENSSSSSSSGSSAPSAAGRQHRGGRAVRAMPSVPKPEYSTSSSASPPRLLETAAQLRQHARDITLAFIDRLPKLRVLLRLDAEAVFVHDVAATSIAEVVLCYPGMRCISSQRFAHELLILGAPNLVTRLITEVAHRETGIDIHPQTTIGHSFFIDHGTGIVIGGTSIIGNRCAIYQSVTLGARSFPADPITGLKLKTPNKRRHPKLEDDVTVYSNASVLGPVTIGTGATIGGNVFLVNDVPAYTTVLQSGVQTRKIPQRPHQRPVTMEARQPLIHDLVGEMWKKNMKEKQVPEPEKAKAQQKNPKEAFVGSLGESI